MTCHRVERDRGERPPQLLAEIPVAANDAGDDRPKNFDRVNREVEYFEPASRELRLFCLHAPSSERSVTAPHELPVQPRSAGADLSRQGRQTKETQRP